MFGAKITFFAEIMCVMLGLTACSLAPKYFNAIKVMIGQII